MKQFGEPEIEYFDLSALGHENIGRLDVPMDDRLGVRCLKCLGNLCSPGQQMLQFNWFAADPLLQRLPFQ